MKTVTRLILALTFIITISCEGPMGPPGVDGENLLGSVIEITGDFTPNEGYELYYAFPSNIKVYDGDVVLVHILWETAETNNGGEAKVWRLLPQTVVLNDGILQYNFDSTNADVRIFLEGTTNFNNLLPAETQGQIFRITVLPAALLKNKAIDYKDYESVMDIIKLNPDSIIKDNI
ncbi:MAG: hypothetical protein LBV47_04720 [Bacteroidales bacterium]|jgi:hypothetical protein|nr:hypothetical protein [Bacteroidales bacterium]